MNEALDRAARAGVDATLKQAKKEGFSIQGGAATHLAEVLAPKIAAIIPARASAEGG